MSARRRQIGFHVPERGRRWLLLALAPLLVLVSACAAEPQKRPRAVPVGYDGEFVLWWNDTAVRERGTYSNGERDGEVVVYYKDGGPHYEGTYVDGTPHGLLTTYHPDGTVATTETYADGLLDGTLSRFSKKTGAIVERTDFERGAKNGKEEQWRESGQKAFEGHWAYNLPSGKWKHWDAIGRLTRTEHYWIIAGRPAGYLETVYASSGVASVQTLKRRVAEVWEGWVTTWHDNGRQSSLVEEVGGAPNGRDVSWDRSGRLVAEGLRVNGLRDGVWTFFGEPGEEARSVVYVAEQPVETLEEVPLELTPDAGGDGE